MYKKIELIILLMCFVVNCYSNQPKELPELGNIFSKYKVGGSILIYNQNENDFMGYNLERQAGLSGKMKAQHGLLVI